MALGDRLQPRGPCAQLGAQVAQPIQGAAERGHGAREAGAVVGEVGRAGLAERRDQLGERGLVGGDAVADLETGVGARRQLELVAAGSRARDPRW